ncbi:pilus assembly protein N-terminal domain-containing protein, partial [Bordetella pertussis]
MKQHKVGRHWAGWAMALACLGAAAPLAAQPAAPAGAAQARELLLEVKGQQPLRLDAAPSRVAIADPQVADVKVLAPGVGRPGEVLLIGRQAGTTELRVWSRGSRDPQVWTVRVLPQV